MVKQVKCIADVKMSNGPASKTICQGYRMTEICMSFLNNLKGGEN